MKNFSRKKNRLPSYQSDLQDKHAKLIPLVEFIIFFGFVFHYESWSANDVDDDRGFQTF